MKEDLTPVEKMYVRKSIEQHKLGTNKTILQQVCQSVGMGKWGFAMLYPQGPAKGNWESPLTPAELLKF